MSGVLEMDYGLSQQEVMDFDVDNEERQGFHQIRSSRVPQTNYAVGVFRGKELHLTPIQTVYQMRPEFSYINKREDEHKKKIEERKKPLQETENNGEPIEEEIVPVEVPLRVAYQESEKAKRIRETSWAHLQAAEESEQFIKMAYIEKEKISANSRREEI